ncbi:class I SAM-dependent methyltransferase [Helicobacter zhangjianzhongii]|uniref:Class I SAM-dependent methyltransferase n=1 Tax=Helicobacter zhangjianzhongii TaxID=2974574 RepID=A0ACC6FSA5_9HELI|nr:MULTISPECIES: class I SAM-dependent methyltransferase [unclassified Helicobacter]MDL0079780.1 class I SAM-dependent methyltransferase [Helicobacter sp. CPD2-1]MDL0082125.1 class I SAM-dependent methyltransferase [Helicobacter sp. XJK30-2]
MNSQAHNTQTKDQHTKQEAQRTQRSIIAMFDDIAKDYDKTNRILSLGIDISWRKDAVKRAYKARNAKDIERIVDVACGSGDMIKHWHSYALESNIVVGEMIGIDPSQEMLKIAQKKLQAIGGSFAKVDSSSRILEDSQAKLESKKLDSKISLHLGEAKDLSTLQSQSVDILSISYGLRNVLEYKQALREFARVLKPGGIVVVLDFFKNSSPSLIDRIIGIYTKHILPCIGYLISRNYAAYKYLPDSMESFITPDELALAFKEANLQPLEIKSYSAGISHLVLGQKPCDKVDKS